MKKALFDKIDCIRIPVENLEKGLDFYSKKLGHELLWKTETSVGLKLGDDKTEIDFHVKDVQQASKAFVQAGGEIVKGPFEIPIGRCVVVKDPWENQYVILDSSKGIFETDENKKVIGLKKKQK